MIRVSQIKLKYDPEDGDFRERLEDALAREAARLLRVPREKIRHLRILRESVDARKKPEISLIYTADLDVEDEERVWRRFSGKNREGNRNVLRVEPGEYRFPSGGTERQEHPAVIVGMGPAGLFCGYFLAMHGYRPILLERGRAVEERREDVERFWRTGKLLADSNVQFGEGGAGAFSDGKLNTLVKDKDGRNRAVLRVLAECGAGEEILYQAKPHIGTDALCRVVRQMRERIIRMGGEVRFESRVTELLIDEGRVRGVRINNSEYLPCEQLVLAVGHSARDTFAMLYDKGVPMEAKSFAVGLRVEHPQEMINESQYGRRDPGPLGAAPYKVTAQADNGRGVYSFCMCPGGYVVNASSEEGHLAVNGMSYSARDGSNANSAVIVSVTPADYGSEHPLAGVEFQRGLERKAFRLAQGRIPMQRYGDFKENVERGKPQDQAEKEWGGEVRAGEDARTGKEEQRGEDVLVCREGQRGEEARADEREQAGAAYCGFEPQNKGLCAWADVSSILPRECNEAFVQGMTAFGRMIRGFDRPDAILSGVESRTSSPVRIPRDETMQSAIRGLYPCGEGAGYAGGITSAAMDGLRVAEAIASCFAVNDRWIARDGRGSEDENVQ